jgi:hypothetical protein
LSGKSAKVFGRSEVAGFLAFVITAHHAIAAITAIWCSPIGSKFEKQVNAYFASRFPRALCYIHGIVYFGPPASTLAS